MRPFSYTSPRTLAEAAGLLQRGDAARPLAGGTDLLTLMKADVAAPASLVDLKRVWELSGKIEDSAQGLTIDALTTLAQIEANWLVNDRYPALAQAVASAATPQLRNMATIGGNLLQRPRCWYFRSPRFHCWLQGGGDCPARDGENQLHAIFGSGPCYAVHPSDPAVALLALGAEVRLLGHAGERTVSLADFFAPPTDQRRTETVAQSDEILLSVRVPPPPPGTRSAYFKAMDRKVWAFALVSAAAVLRLDGRRVEAVSLVLGGVATVPWRCQAAEQVLVGQTLSADLLTRAVEAALAQASPLAHNAYKVPLAKALLRRALDAVAGNQAPGG